MKSAKDGVPRRRTNGHNSWVLYNNPRLCAAIVVGAMAVTWWRCKDLLTITRAGLVLPPLTQSYEFDHRSAARDRKRMMQKYDFPYNLTHIDRRTDLSLQEFYDVYDAKWPVIITDVVRDWPCSKWTAEFFLSNYGKDVATTRAVNSKVDQAAFDSLGELRDIADLPHGGSLESAFATLVPLRAFYDQAQQQGRPGSWMYVEDELFIPSRPELHQQVGPNPYFKENFFKTMPRQVAPWDAMLLWGTAWSRSYLHVDPYNWTGTNAVIFGRKRWKLYPPGQDQLLYVMPDRRCGFPLDCFKYNSLADAFDLDLARFPKVSEARVLEFDQLPGELLIIPPGWFHQALNVEETMAISGQAMNRNNYRIVLEEMLKAGAVMRNSLPLDIQSETPELQVKTFMSLLSPEILENGEKVTEDFLRIVREKAET